MNKVNVPLVDLLEDVLETTVVLFQDCVLGGHELYTTFNSYLSQTNSESAHQWQLLLERHLERRVGEATNRLQDNDQRPRSMSNVSATYLVSVVHRKGDTSALEVKHGNGGGLATVRGREHKLQPPGAWRKIVCRTILSKFSLVSLDLISHHPGPATIRRERQDGRTIEFLYESSPRRARFDSGPSRRCMRTERVAHSARRLSIRVPA